MTRVAAGGWRTLSLTGHRSIAYAPAELSEWENLLRELELKDDDQALNCVQRADSRGTLIVRFVRSCFHLRYIPEPVLAELDLQHAVESCFDNRNLGKHLPRKPHLATAHTQQGE